MMAFVEPLIAMSTAMALWKASAVRMSRGFKSSQTMSTMRLPQSSDMRTWLESGAGMDDAPESVMPSASASDAIVDAVPMVIQKPGDRAMQASMSFHSCSLMLPAQRSVQYFQRSVPLPSG